ncbi:cyclin dependent kinase inhibitor 1Bb isoform X2 [Acipenser ruthenus]|uniref:cyclin dependent kinase inhibitor 1Bb isoform X2 n=1 Tax=Acipenser ruthenus TaxID=7906 RepID=UPI00145A14FE|nr:cyclin dependent kinase inhibitor 1Bb isoform X2 [Acipenser ruthenus]
MSNVRISNGSPTLERMDARQSDHPKPSACRTLFGTVDHEELKSDLKGHLQALEGASCARWNFDFANHKPMKPGRYEWEIVDDKEVPGFYTRIHPSSKRMCSSTTTSEKAYLDFNGNHNGVMSPCQRIIVGARLSEEQKPEKQESEMDCKDHATGQRKRPASTNESTAQSKRANSGTTDEVSGSKCPNVSSVEQTPRKSSPRQST